MTNIEIKGERACGKTFVANAMGLLRNSSVDERSGRHAFLSAMTPSYIEAQVRFIRPDAIIRISGSTVEISLPQRRKKEVD